MKVIAKTLEDTRQFAKDLIVEISKRVSDRALVLDLKGDLGAGKTTLVQMIGHELGVTETIQSPTFVLMKTYDIQYPPAKDLPDRAWRAGSIFKHLIHIDAYRIEHIEEVKILRLDEVFADPSNIVCIEWAEKIKEIMPEDAIKVECELLGGDEHRYEF